MSNIANTVLFLKGNDNRFIVITNQETGKQIGKQNVYLQDIPDEDLETYIKLHLGPITKPTLVWVEMRSKNGSASKKEASCKIEVSPTNYQPLPEAAQPSILVPETQPVRHLPQVTQEHYPAPSFLGNPGSGNVFGLGFAEVIGMQVKADRLNHKEEQLLDLKEDHKELKQKYNLLEVDHRATLTKLSIAEAQKDMAVMLAKAENRSVFDSPAFASLMDKAPELIGSLAAMKGGAALPAVAGALGSPDMSETHRQFLEYVADNLNEQQVNFLGSVCHYINNEGFVNQLKMLIQQQNGAV